MLVTDFLTLSWTKATAYLWFFLAKAFPINSLSISLVILDTSAKSSSSVGLLLVRVCRTGFSTVQS